MNAKPTQIKPVADSEKSISTIAEVITSPVDKKNLPDETPVHLCNYTDVYYNQKITKDMPFMEATARKSEIDKFSIKENDVVITKDSETADDIGVPAYVESVKENLLCGYHLAILRPKKRIDGRYLAYALTHPRTRHDFYRYANGITRFGLTLGAYEHVKVRVPPYAEQKAIAHILQTWDKAIEKTEALIAAKEKRFQWLVTSLMNRICLDANEKRKLNDVFFFKKGRGMSKGDIEKDGKKKCILYGQLYTTYSEVAGEVVSATDVESGVLSQSGDLLIPSSTTTTAKDLANATALMQDGVLLGADIIILRPRDRESISSEYFAYYLTHHKRNELANKGQGITIVHLYSSHIKDIEVEIPSICVQKRVASILINAQKEISTLRAIADQYRVQKRGLMQKLLTGQWRINPSRKQQNG